MEAESEKRINLLDLPALRVDLVIRNQRMYLDAEGALVDNMKDVFEMANRVFSGEKIAAILDDGSYVYSLLVPPVPSKGFRKLLRAQAMLSLGQPVPEYLCVSIDHRCTLRCEHCAHPPSQGRLLSSDEILEIIDQARDLGCYSIQLTGGDPLLRKDVLFDVLERAEKDDTVYQIFGPGHLLTRENCRELRKRGLYAVYAVLDSPHGEKHDQRVGVRGSYDLTLRGIRNALEEGLLVGVVALATNEFVENREHERLFELCAKLGVHELMISDIIPTGKALRRTDLILRPENRRKLVEFHEIANRRDWGPRVFVGSYVKGPRGVGCLSGVRWPHVDACGYVKPCEYTPIHFGNVRESSFREIYERMASHPEYSKRRLFCRMQTPSFRKKYIDRIPEGAPLPYPIDELEKSRS